MDPKQYPFIDESQLHADDNPFLDDCNTMFNQPNMVTTRTQGVDMHDGNDQRQHIASSIERTTHMPNVSLHGIRANARNHQSQNRFQAGPSRRKDHEIESDSNTNRFHMTQ